MVIPFVLLATTATPEAIDKIVPMVYNVTKVQTNRLLSEILSCYALWANTARTAPLPTVPLADTAVVGAKRLPAIAGTLEAPAVGCAMLGTIVRKAVEILSARCLRRRRPAAPVPKTTLARQGR